MSTEAAQAPALELRFELRIPPFADLTHGKQYAAALDMCGWAERIGVPNVTVGEHHGDPAGFCPSPTTFAAAILSRTERISVTITILAPLHDPVRLAEQLAMVDCIGPGRFSVILGAGYREAEFLMAGIERGERGHLLEEAVEVLRSSWTGEPFEWRGRSMLVTPRPESPGGPRVFIGGKTVFVARRAARLRLPFFPAHRDPAILEAYTSTCREVGYVGTIEGVARAGRPGFLMVSRDPEATWKEIGPNALYEVQTYASWQDDKARSAWVIDGVETIEDVRASGGFLVLTPEQCIEQIARDGGITLHPLMGGLPPELAWEGLELFESEVLPYIR